MKCVSCKKEAKIKILYPFCDDCFIKHYERRVEKLVKKFKLVRKGDRILVAVSGGKDSLSCAHVLAKLREDFEFEMGVLHIDVGVLECTNQRTESVVKGFCEARDVPFYLISLRDIIDIDIYKITRRRRRPVCSTCGMLKRYTLNKFAHENGFNKIATGHCADDIVRFFFKNWLARNFDWIAKFRPITFSNHPKQVTRIRPLFECLEKENLIYTKLNKITVAGCSRCSYFLRKDKWNDLLKIIDEKMPFFKVEFVRGLEFIKIKDEKRPFFKVEFVRGLEFIKIKDEKEKLKIRECKYCGEPTDQEICGICKIKEKFALL